MSRSILAVPGLASMSQVFLRDLWLMCSEHAWDVDTVAAVISVESGFKPDIKNPLKGQTASGLLQFTDATARGLGVKDGAEGVRRMSALEQLPLVEKYYVRAFGSRSPRTVDYYLAVLGVVTGQPDTTILWRVTDPKKFNNGEDNLYTLNRGLDVDKNGAITVGDTLSVITKQQAKAAGKRIEILADIDISRAGSHPLAPPLGSSPSGSAALLFGVPSNREGDLPVLHVGSKGSAVRTFFRVICEIETNEYDPAYKPLVEDFQAKRGLKPDGVIGRDTWYRFLKLVSGSG